MVSDEFTSFRRSGCEVSSFLLVITWNLRHTGPVSQNHCDVVECLSQHAYDRLGMFPGFVVELVPPSGVISLALGQ